MRLTHNRPAQGPMPRSNSMPQCPAQWPMPARTAPIQTVSHHLPDVPIISARSFASAILLPTIIRGRYAGLRTRPAPPLATCVDVRSSKRSLRTNPKNSFQNSYNACWCPQNNDYEQTAPCPIYRWFSGFFTILSIYLSRARKKYKKNTSHDQKILKICRSLQYIFISIPANFQAYWTNILFSVIFHISHVQKNKINYFPFSKNPGIFFVLSIHFYQHLCKFSGPFDQNSIFRDFLHFLHPKNKKNISHAQKILRFFVPPQCIVLNTCANFHIKTHSNDLLLEGSDHSNTSCSPTLTLENVKYPL